MYIFYHVSIFEYSAWPKSVYMHIRAQWIKAMYKLQCAVECHFLINAFNLRFYIPC